MKLQPEKKPTGEPPVATRRGNKSKAIRATPSEGDHERRPGNLEMGSAE